jgi:hypothetical protein
VTNRFRTSPAQPWWWLWTGVWLVLLLLLITLVVSGFVSSAAWLTRLIPDIAVLVLAAIVACLTRKVLLIVNAARARTVEIMPQGAIPGDVLASFREALTSVYLSSPSTVPGQSAPQDFLSDVREVATAQTTWGVVLLALAAVFRIRAYRVSCTARENSPDGLKSLTVEVTSGVSKDVQVTTVCDEAWDDVVRRAACHVAAYVLPRTWQARQPPWTPWRRRQLDPDLFYQFHEARRLARAGRLEESLSHFDRATALDPLNPYIRIEKATVLDELGLYIDAFVTYVDVVTTESWYDRPLWDRYRDLFADRDGWDAPPRRRERSPNGRAALQLARYRVVCSLAASQRLAQQWHRHAWPGSEKGGSAKGRPDQPERDREACRVIAMLRPLLGAFYKKMLERYGVPSQMQKAVLNEASEAWLRRVMQFAALLEADQLEQDYTVRHLRRWHRRLLISQSAIRILPVWSAIQFRYVEIAQEKAGEPLDGPGTLPLGSRLPLRLPEIRGRGVFSRRRRGVNPLDDEEWPPSVDAIKACVRWALGRRSARLGWLEHYNAGCTFAVAMLTPELYRGRDGRLHCEVPLTKNAAVRHGKLIRLAISELTQAVTATDSQFAGVSPWLRRGDQDLNDLRVTESYATFVDRYLSPGASWPPVPPNVARLTMSAHDLLLVQRMGKLRQARWEARAQGADSVAWADLAEEAEWWEHLREYCLNYRDWRTRLRFVTLGRASCPPGTSFGAAIPALQTDTGWLDQNPWPPDATTPPSPELVRATGISDDNSAVRHAQGWLRRSDHLDRCAQDLIQSRNDALDGLARSLTDPAPLGEALALTARAAELAAWPPLTGSAVLLASAWQAIASDASLSRGIGSRIDGPGHVEQLRRHFGLDDGLSVAKINHRE